MVATEAWPPRTGEAIGAQRAGALLRAADSDVRRVCVEVAARIARLSPGSRTATISVGAGDLAAQVRQPLTAGCTVALVGYLDRGGRMAVIPVELGWDGAVYPRAALPVHPHAGTAAGADHDTVQWLPDRQITTPCSDGRPQLPR